MRNSKFLVLSMVILFSGCTHGGKDPTYADFRKAWAMENRALHEKLKSNPMFRFPSYTKDQYMVDMHHQNSKIVDTVKSFEMIELGTSPSAFVICVKSKDIAMCDNSLSPVVDRIKMGGELPDLKSLMDQVRGP